MPIQLKFFFGAFYVNISNAISDWLGRSEDELDAVTLHNAALMNMESKPTDGFEKLQFLLQQV